MRGDKGHTRNLLDMDIHAILAAACSSANAAIKRSHSESITLLRRSCADRSPERIHVENTWVHCLNTQEPLYCHYD